MTRRAGKHEQPRRTQVYDDGCRRDDADTEPYRAESASASTRTRPTSHDAVGSRVCGEEFFPFQNAVGEVSRRWAVDGGDRRRRPSRFDAGRRTTPPSVETVDGRRVSATQAIGLPSFQRRTPTHLVQPKGDASRRLGSRVRGGSIVVVKELSASIVGGHVGLTGFKKAHCARRARADDADGVRNASFTRVPRGSRSFDGPRRLGPFFP